MTDDDRAILNALVPLDQQTGVLRDDLVAAIAEVVRIREENTRRGGAMINALHRDSGSWRTCEYLTGLKRMYLSRWGKKVIGSGA